jgi:hypothetical protein
MNKRHSVNLSALLILVVLYAVGCDSTQGPGPTGPAVRFSFEQRESLNSEPIANLGEVGLDLADSVPLQRGARKELSIDSTSSIRFRTWREFTDDTDWKIFVLLKPEGAWYSGLYVSRIATLLYAGQPFEGEVYAFFLESITPLPEEPIPFFIESDEGVDSIMVDPNTNIVPKSAFQYTNRSMMQKMKDHPTLYIEASVDDPISRDYIPVLMHSPYEGAGFGGTAAFELYDKTEETIATGPTRGIADDYEAYMFSFRR